MQVGLLLALVPLVTWGTADYLAAKLGNSFNPYEVNFIYVIYGIPGFLAVLLYKGFPHFSASTLGWYFVASAILNMGFLSMVKGFKSGAVGIVAAVANSYAVVTMLLTAVLFNVAIKPVQIVAVISIVVGIALVSYHKSDAKKSHTMRALKYALAALFMWGISFTILGQVSKQNPWYVNQFVLSLTAGTFGVAFYLYNRLTNKKPAEIKDLVCNWRGVVGGLAGTVGAFALFAAFSISGNPVIVAAIASAAPLVTGVLAYTFDKEKLTQIQRAGILCIVSAVVVINLLG